MLYSARKLVKFLIFWSECLQAFSSSQVQWSIDKCKVMVCAELQKTEETREKGFLYEIRWETHMGGRKFRRNFGERRLRNPRGERRKIFKRKELEGWQGDHGIESRDLIKQTFTPVCTGPFWAVVINSPTGYGTNWKDKQQHSHHACIFCRKDTFVNAWWLERVSITLKVKT